MSMFKSNAEGQKEMLKRKTLQRLEQFSNKNWVQWQFEISHTRD